MDKPLPRDQIVTCEGKHKFKTANNARKANGGGRHGRTKLSVYRCAFCNFYHVGGGKRFTRKNRFIKHTKDQGQ